MNVGALMDSFAGKRVLIIGDVMLDSYMIGSVTRMSPEAPVPVVNLKSAESRLGGAANVALNIKSLGAEAILCSVIGKDFGGDKILSLLKDQGLKNEGILAVEKRKTSVKTRIIGNKQQIVRIDDEEEVHISSEIELGLISKIKALINEKVDAIIFEDYNKGVLTKNVIQTIVDFANENGVITTVDPKKENFFEYKNVTLFKPNLKELKDGLGIEFDFSTNKSSFEDAILELENRLNNSISFVTLSEHGVFIKDATTKEYIPAHIRNISDVSGAGDTVISVATLALASGLSIDRVARIANLSGGLVCEMNGVVPIDRNLLMTELDKIKF